MKYGTSDELKLKSQMVKSSLADDNTCVIRLSDLTPNTRYYYRPFVGENSGPGGSFKTLRDPERLQSEHNPRGLFNFSFEFACGNNQSPDNGGGPSLQTYTTMLRTIKENVDFAILNGDWLYEEDREFSAEQWKQQVGITEKQVPSIIRIAPGISGIWENYKTYLKRASNLAEWHRHVPSYYTYDDHEALNDIYGTGEIGFQDRRAVVRDIAVRAWFDYLAWANPVHHETPPYFGTADLIAGSDILIDKHAKFDSLVKTEHANLHVHWGGQAATILDPEPAKETGNPNHGVYEMVEVIDAKKVRIRPAARHTGRASYSIGRRCYGSFQVSNCEFFLVDTRSHRDLHDVDNPSKPGLSMLGKQQLKWLTESINQSSADFIFVVSSVNFMVPHVGAGGGADLNSVVKKDDAWTVFLEEREQLIQLWDKLNKPVFVLTGDLHNSFAIKITDNVWEFASGPHNSVNHRPLEDEGGRPANGRFQYGPRPCEIRWSTYVLSDIPRPNRLFPQYCVVQINNVFNNPVALDSERLVAFPKPHVIFQYFDGKTGKLSYSETIHAN